MKKIDQYFKNYSNTYFVAEIGNNHMGDLSKALELVDCAKKTNADAVKFQYIKPKLLVNKSLFPERVEQLKKICLTLEDLTVLRKHCDDIELDFGISLFDIEGVEEANCNLDPDFVKIASSDFTYSDLIQETLSKFDNVVISSGMASKDEIEKFFAQYGQQITNLIFCYCVSLYPAPIENLNLNNIKTIKNIVDNQSLNIKLGYSDHSDSEAALISAFALGCTFLEKHFTDDKHNKEFRDHNLSSTEEELTFIIQKLKDTVISLGAEEFKRSEEEIANKAILRRSAYYSKSKVAGEKLHNNDLIYLRPQNLTEQPSLNSFNNPILSRDVLELDIVKIGDVKNGKE